MQNYRRHLLDAHLPATEAQKLEERATTAEQSAKTAESEMLRLKVALKKGLSESQAKRLIGDSEEEHCDDQ